MGYNTEFDGGFELDRPLKPEHLAYLKQFSETRRMKRIVAELEKMPDPIREAVGLPIGPEGAYFVGSTASGGQDFDSPSVLDGNVPPEGQPSLWCHWTPDDDGYQIICNEGDHFYGYVKWLQYLIDNFLTPWGYFLNGDVAWEGDDLYDDGVIRVTDNRIEVFDSITVTDISGSPRRLRAFLCHASSDKSAVRDLYRLMSGDGISPWFDEESLLPGQDWQHEISKAVRNSDVVIVCLSRESINKIGFVQKEIKYALDVADEQPEGSIFIIPLKLEECNVPNRLRRWQWLNYFEEEGYERLLLALRARANALSVIDAES